jgi:hypothetical protein
VDVNGGRVCTWQRRGARLRQRLAEQQAARSPSPVQKRGQLSWQRERESELSRRRSGGGGGGGGAFVASSRGRRPAGLEPWHGGAHDSRQDLTAARREFERMDADGDG